MAAVVAHVDRFNVYEGETVHFSVEVSGSDRGEPQFSVLQKDFEILSRSKSSSYTFTNGSGQSKTLYDLMIRPRHAGAVTIPAVKVGSAATAPIMLQVRKVEARQSPAAHPQGDIWINMTIEPAHLTVQQQGVITIRIYQAISLNQAQLSEPDVADAIVERLGDDRSYQTRENGRSWQVIERRYALFPQKRGQLKIAPVQLDGRALVSSPSVFSTVMPVRVRSNALTVDVQGIADGWSGDTWLPAKQLRIEEDWPQGELKVGEPITRTLTLYADGLSSSQLPAFSHEVPEHLKVYPDKPVLKDEKRMDGVHGMRQEKVAILPTQPGTYILPAVVVRWWNTTTHKAEEATLPARTFTVVGAVAAAAPQSIQHKAAVVVQQQPQQHLAPALLANNMVAAWWQWLAIVCALGWLFTLAYLFYWQRGKRYVSHESKSAELNLKQALKAVQAACDAGDPKECEKALLKWVALQYPEMKIHSLHALAQASDRSMRDVLIALEEALYAPTPSSWRADALLKLIKEGKLRLPLVNSVGAESKNSLPELYPHRA